MLTKEDKRMLREDYLDSGNMPGEEDVIGLTIEETAWLMQEAKPPLKERMGDRVKQLLRASLDLSLVVSSTSGYPYMEEGTAEVFCDTRRAEQLAETLSRDGWKVKAKGYAGTEDLFLYLYRIGVQNVRFSTDDASHIFRMEDLHTEQHVSLDGPDIYTLNPELHAACNRYMAESAHKPESDAALRAETEYLDRISDAKLLFAVARGVNTFEPQFAEFEGKNGKVAALCVFSDETELLKCFDEEGFVTFLGSLDDVIEKGEETGAVIDPYGAGLVIDADALVTYRNFNSAKNRTLVFMADMYGMAPEETKRRLQKIITHEDIWAEFVKASKDSSRYLFNYPFKKAITVNGYTAERVSHLLQATPLDAYVALACLREDFDKTIKALKAGEFDI